MKKSVGESRAFDIHAGAHFRNAFLKSPGHALLLKAKTGFFVALVFTTQCFAETWQTGGSNAPYSFFPALTTTNVGIGKNNPAAKLDVNGTILSRGANAPTSGIGVEIDYGGIAGTGRIFAYDRGTSTYKPFRVGNSFDVSANGDVSGIGSASFAGNLGVGISPTQKLDVNGAANIRGAIVLDGDAHWIGSNYTGATNDRWQMFMDKQSLNTGELHIRTGDDGNEPIFFEQATQTGASIRMAVASDGRIGVGTPWPNTTMHLIDPVPGGSVWLTLERVSTATEGGIQLVGPNNKKFWIFQDQNSSDLRFEASGLAGEDDVYPRLELPSETKNIHACLSGGTFSVGNSRTVDVSKKLFVTGDAQVTGNLKVASVTTGVWSIVPDYVFEKDYKLASLRQVEDFVNKNRHLPEIPSAKEMKAKGIDLAEMNMKLLRKVEELTLYSIQQEKRVKSLESRLDAMAFRK